jgi:hypothetical protein
MQQIVSILKKDGHLCIIDHFYNGLLYDKATSKIIYTLTTTTFSPIVTINKALGSASAGVCFLSKKMWLNMFSKTGFMVEIMNEKPIRKMTQLKKLCLLNKNHTEDNMFILKQQNKDMNY